MNPGSRFCPLFAFKRVTTVHVNFPPRSLSIGGLCQALKVLIIFLKTIEICKARQLFPFFSLFSFAVKYDFLKKYKYVNLSFGRKSLSLCFRAMQVPKGMTQWLGHENSYNYNIWFEPTSAWLTSVPCNFAYGGGQMPRCPANTDNGKRKALY